MGGAPSNSKDTKKLQNVQRRKLSIAYVENSGIEENSATNQEENPGLILGLDLENDPWMGWQNRPAGSDHVPAPRFGDPRSLELGMGCSCRKGLKPEFANQDSWFIVKVDDRFALYGVLDGHGQHGQEVSNFVKENLHKLIVRDARFKTADMPQMLRDCFKKMHSLLATADRMKKIRARLSGTGCTVCVHDLEANKLTIAHVGDSTCCISHLSDGGKLVSTPLTRDHRPDLEDERTRIRQRGGHVKFDGHQSYRVYAGNTSYPGLSMSRCLGDLLGHEDAGLTCEPEVVEREVQPNDHILFLCTNGIWKIMSPQDAANIVAPYESPKQAMAGADTLAAKAWDLWIQEEGGAVVDDITVVLIYLWYACKPSSTNTNILQASFDGEIVSFAWLSGEKACEMEIIGTERLLDVGLRLGQELQVPCQTLDVVFPGGELLSKIISDDPAALTSAVLHL